MEAGNSMMSKPTTLGPSCIFFPSTWSKKWGPFCGTFIINSYTPKRKISRALSRSILRKEEDAWREQISRRTTAISRRWKSRNCRVWWMGGFAGMRRRDSSWLWSAFTAQAWIITSTSDLANLYSIDDKPIIYYWSKMYWDGSLRKIKQSISVVFQHSNLSPIIQLSFSVLLIDVVEMVVVFVAHDADILLALLAHCQVAALPINNADLPLPAPQAGVFELSLFVVGDFGRAFFGALPLADLVDVSLEYLVLGVVVADFLVALKLLEFLLLPKWYVLFVCFLLLDGCGQLRSIYL